MKTKNSCQVQFKDKIRTELKLVINFDSYRVSKEDEMDL